MPTQSNFIPTQYDRFINFIQNKVMVKYFPKNLMLESRFSFLGSDNPDKSWLKYGMASTIREIIDEKELSGNAQRGQITELAQKELGDKDKRYWDFVLINAIQNGEIMGGPFYAVIKGLPKPLQNDWLHRTHEFRQFGRGTWTFTNESPYPNSPIKFKGKNINDIILEMGQDWIDEKFFNRRVDSEVYVYYDDNLDINLRNSSVHFGLKNQNATDIQIIHSLHSEINTQIKLRAGLRLLTFKQNADGEVKISKEIHHTDIIKDTPFKVLSEKNVSGYDKKGKRLYRSGYRYRAGDWVKLKPYQLTAPTVFSFHCAQSGNYYPNLSLQPSGDVSNFVNGTFGVPPEVNWTKLDKNLGDFSNFWHNCQDYLKFHLKYNISSKKGGNPNDLFNHTVLLNTYVIWNAFNQVGNFIAHDGDFYKVYTKMMRYWHLREPYIVKGDSKNFIGHRSGANFEKQFFNLMELIALIKHECTYDDNDLSEPVTFKFDVDKENYLDWGFRFTDIDRRTFTPKFRGLVSTKYNGCFITGKNTIELAAHHNIYHKNGGKTADIKNCVMIDKKINGNLNAFSKSSEGIEDFLKNDVILPERKPYWENGGLQKLIDYENNVDNYYWPEADRYQVEIHKNKIK